MNTYEQSQGKRTSLILEIKNLNAEYQTLDRGSVEAMAMLTTIAALRVELCRLQEKMLQQSRTYYLATC